MNPGFNYNATISHLHCPLESSEGAFFFLDTFKDHFPFMKRKTAFLSKSQIHLKDFSAFTLSSQAGEDGRQGVRQLPEAGKETIRLGCID